MKEVAETKNHFVIGLPYKTTTDTLLSPKVQLNRNRLLHPPPTHLPTYLQQLYWSFLIGAERSVLLWIFRIYRRLRCAPSWDDSVLRCSGLHRSLYRRGPSERRLLEMSAVPDVACIWKETARPVRKSLVTVARIGNAYWIKVE